MSRLDRHIALVQSKLAFAKFITAMVWTTLAFLAALWLGILIDRLFQVHPPKAMAFVWAGIGAAIFAAFIYSILRKPTSHEAAVAIDERLGLKEKFSTALFIRHNNDPFAIAAVRDAEQTADNVSLHKQFPLSFPRSGYYTIAAALAVLITAQYFPTFDLFGREAHRRQLAIEEARRDEAKKVVEKALATVNSYPKAVQSDQNIQIAKRDLESMLKQPITDTEQTRRTAFKALEQSNDALKEEIRKNDQYAMAKSNEKMLKSINPPTDEQGPVADAQRDIAKGDFSKAIDNLNNVAQKFDKMSDDEQKKAADQMQKMAQQLQQMAQNPAQQQQMQKQLQQMGATQQQAQQLAQTMQQAAQGNQQAQQQLQQMQQQMAQQAQAQGGQKMAQQMQQMMKQMQAQANSQASAQQMAQAAQQMAQAMKQGASQQGGKQQGGNQQGQMAQAQQQMQQAMGQMDAVQKDAEQLAAAQSNTQQAASDAANQNQNGSGQDQNSGGPKPSGSDSTGKWQQGDPSGKNGNGAGGPGIGKGGHVGLEQAPYAIKKEAAPVQDIDKGKILASTFVKAGTVKGESKVQLSQVAQSAMKDATDDVDEESVSKESQKVVKDYFETMQKGE